MELYGRVRRAVLVEGRSQRAVAREFGFARVGGEDAALLGTAGLPAAAGGAAPEAGPWVGVIDAILEEDKTRPAKQRHTAKRISSAQRRTRVQRRLHHREGLCACGDAAWPGDVRAAEAPGRRGASRLRRSVGSRCRRGAEGALSGDGSAALRRLLRGGVSSRDDRSFSGRPCASLRLFRRGAHAHSLRFVPGNKIVPKSPEDALEVREGKFVRL